MGDCLLLAISKGYDRIVELLLNTDPFKTKSLYKYSQVQKRLNSPLEHHLGNTIFAPF